MVPNVGGFVHLKYMSIIDEAPRKRIMILEIICMKCLYILLSYHPYPKVDHVFLGLPWYSDVENDIVILFQYISSFVY